MQTELAIQIKNSLHSGKASASWLIVGARGVGKRLCAEKLATDLTGLSTDFNPNVKWLECDLTETAKKDIQKIILAGQSVENTNDYTRKTEITVDDVRSGCQFLSLKSENLKILIIDLADEMNENAQNALLKTLEEPYPNTLILLLCENVGKLLPTILSRCQVGHIYEKPISEMILELKKLYPKQDENELNLIASLSSGSMGMAQSLIEINAINIYHDIERLCVPINQISVTEIMAFADNVFALPEGFSVVKYLILEYIHNLGKRISSESLDKGYDLACLYQQISDMWRNQQMLNLDKKQMLLEVFYTIGKELE